MSEGASLPSWARVGARVVCVDPYPQWKWHKGISAGTVLAVRSVVRCPVSGGWGFRFKGIYNPHHPTIGLEMGYWGTHFRPAVDPKSETEDLALFRDLLTQRQPDGIDA